MQDKEQDKVNREEKQRREDPKDTGAMEREKLEQSRKEPDKNSESQVSRR